ncbi:MacB family efflux pump subunit [Pseudomonas fluorescens]|uniref:MacB family efflux pump subunit n=1 Tax=Pseudomonas fluorescens TaxID=294 RepID=UPI001BB1C527|nr:MacB family efflux pump subunit [Pseudomonas fluorescens]
MERSPTNRAPDGEPLLKLINVSRCYFSGQSRADALRRIDLEIHAGEMVAIVGTSGSGKSTLLNILGCLVPPSEGQYCLRGRNVSHLSSNELADLRRSTFGFVFQRYHLLGHLNAEENVLAPALYAAGLKKSLRARAQDLLRNLGLAERVHYHPGQLSGGQQQRVSIARALMNGGEIILADEPTGALDTQSGEEVMAILRELNAQGHTVILVTHNPDIAAYARRVIHLQDGSIVADQINPSDATEAMPRPLAAPSATRRAAVSAMTGWLGSLRMASSWLVKKPLQAGLTILGIVIGIAAVSSVIALGEGARDRVIQEISSMGADTIDIYSGKDWGDLYSVSSKTLRESDVDYLRSLPYVDSISPVIATSVTVTSPSASLAAQVLGVSDELIRVRGLSLTEGVFFSKADVQRQSQIAVIDDNMQKKLFPSWEDPIGQVILVGPMPTTIVAVIKSTPSAFAGPPVLQIFIPYTTLMARISGQQPLDSIALRVASRVSNELAEANITRLLELKHGSKDFFINSYDAVLQSVTKATRTLNLLIVSVAAISLLVGGIGLMNMMLYSVAERTYEVGVRMAFGARRRDIMQQFLSESCLLCVVGGLLGLLVSFLVGEVAGQLQSQIPLSFSWSSVSVAFLSSAVIGMVFGYLPARNAARLDPVDALARA